KRDSRRRRARNQTRRSRVYPSRCPARDQRVEFHHVLEHPLRSQRCRGVAMRAVVAVRVLALVASLPVASVLAQGAPAKIKATDLSSAEIQEAVKRGIAALTPGVSVNDRLATLADITKYNVAVAVVARPAGPDTRVLSHDKITE